MIYDTRMVQSDTQNIGYSVSENTRIKNINFPWLIFRLPTKRNIGKLSSTHSTVESSNCCKYQNSCLALIGCQPITDGHKSENARKQKLPSLVT